MKFIAENFAIITICLLLFLVAAPLFLEDTNTPWLFVVPVMVISMRMIKSKYYAKQK